MTLHQVAEVLSAQESSPKPFGETAIELGFLREQENALLLLLQTRQTRPISENLADMGVIKREVVLEELSKEHLAAADENESLRLLEFAS